MKRAWLSRRDLMVIIVAAISLIAIFSLLIFANLRISNMIGRSGNFYSLWYGSRAIMFDRISPYDGSVGLEVQNLIYGRPAYNNEDLYLLDVPFHILELFLPLAFISKVNMAFVVYMILCEIFFIGFLAIHTRLMKLSLSPLLFGFCFVMLFLNFYTIETFRFVSTAIPLGFACAAILWTLEMGQDELAGGLFAISVFQFEMTGLFLILIILNVIDHKRWRVLAGFIMTTVVLLSISLFIFPNWFLIYWSQSITSVQFEYGFLVRLLLQGFSSEYGDKAGWCISILATLLVIYEWHLSRSGTSRRFYWVISLALAATPLLGLQVSLNQLFILVPGWLMILSILRERWLKVGDGVFVILSVLFVFIPWAAYLGWLFPNRDHDVILYLFLPIINIVGLYWIRWWVVNPPRTILDAKRNPR